MPNAFWHSSLLDPRKRGRTLSLRAPDDPLAYEDDGPPIARSPAVNERIAEYFVAIRDGDGSGRARAMNAIVDANRADHAVSGVPVYAHTPLPDDFVDALVEPLLTLPTEQRVSAMKSILQDAEPDRQPVVSNQLNERLLAVKAIRATTQETDDDFALEVETEMGSRAERRVTTVGGDGVSGNGLDSFVLASGNPPAPQQPKRIVKPYRRYSTPSGVGGVDRGLQEADEIARDADVAIRKLTSKVVGIPQVEQSDDPLMREFARAVRRYYAEESDRAVAAVAPQLKELAVDMEDQYAAYSSYDDRIYFTRLNRRQSDEEKIITIIHEVLHATTTMKNRAAAVGYDKAKKGSIVQAKHEAEVDNLAKQIAKKLGLIPQNYPPTDWRRYYKPLR